MVDAVGANESCSDNIGKNTGDKDTVQKVKSQIGYVEKDWQGGDETQRWGKEEKA